MGRKLHGYLNNGTLVLPAVILTPAGRRSIAAACCKSTRAAPPAACGRCMPPQFQRAGLQPLRQRCFRWSNYGRRHGNAVADGPGQADADGKQQLRQQQYFREWWQRWHPSQRRHAPDRQRGNTGSITNDVYLSNNGVVGFQPSGITSFSAEIIMDDATGSLVQMGPGKLTLTANNNYGSNERVQWTLFGTVSQLAGRLQIQWRQHRQYNRRWKRRKPHYGRRMPHHQRKCWPSAARTTSSLAAKNYRRGHGSTCWPSRAQANRTVDGRSITHGAAQRSAGGTLQIDDGAQAAAACVGQRSSTTEL